MKLFILAVFVAAGVQPLIACDFCAIYAAAEAQGSGKGFYASVAEQFTHLGTLQLDGKKQANDADQFIDSSVSQVVIGYNLNKRFGLQLNLPVISRTFRRPRGAEIDTGTLSGIGDISVVGNFVAYRKLVEDYSVTWTIMGGLKLPTGDSSRLGEADEESVPPLPDSGIAGHDLALGSGSLDGIIGTAVSARWKRFYATANVQYFIRSEGDFGHQYANDLSWSGGPGVYLLMDDACTLTVQVVVSGETKDKDTFEGVPDDDSAETAVYLGPQIGFTWSDRLSAEIGADLPVGIDNTGLQVVPDYRIHAAVTWRF